MCRNVIPLLGLIFIAMSALSRPAQAMISPIGVSLLPPIQFPFRGSSIVGLRLNCFIGIHESVYGLDLGVVGNVTDKGFGGVQLAGFFNRNRGGATILGAQIASLGNWNLGGSDI